MSATVGIGSIVFVFDSNRRIYQKNEHGKAYGAPIWREHWVPMRVMGETTRSWLLGETWCREKVPKKVANPSKYAFSEDEINRRSYVVENRHKIAERVRSIEDHDLLLQVAELVGYKP